ncbi:MAG: hypothetical protein KF727_05540 [Microbacteriaceae bacterium]|nr:hypothetical protein [Microbacteriaceae bacterium]
MHWTYVHRPGRGIDVDLGVDCPGWNEALSDSISSMPPRNSPDHELSTYWIDRALSALQSEAAEGEALASGNATQIVSSSGRVVARSLYDLFEEEAMDSDEFERLLTEWRAEVVTHQHDFHIEETYRRNGYDG